MSTPWPPNCAYLFTVEAKRHTLAELIDRYLAEVLPHKSPRSVAVQRLHLCRWRPQIGHLLLADVTPAVIVEQRDTLAKQYAPATVRAHMDALSHVLAVAIREWQWLEASPMRSVSRPKLPQERERWLAACKQSVHPLLYLLVALALFTGCRKMELLTLTWQNVDWKRGRIILHHTQNRERRTLPLTGLALAEMKRLARVRRLDTPFIFSSKDGAAPMNIWRPWKRALQEAGIDDFRFHDLQHRAASYLAMHSASLQESGVILGHKTLSMARRYTHLSESHVTAVVARMTTAVFGTA